MLLKLGKGEFLVISVDSSDLSSGVLHDSLCLALIVSRLYLRTLKY